MYMYTCAWFYLFLDWSTFCPHFLLFMFICSFTFSIDFFFQVTGVLSILSLVAFPFQKVCENCHVMDVIISPTCGVHCNLSFKINSSIFFLFFCGSITTNDEPMLLTIEGKWFETIMHIMTNICVSSKTSSTLHFNWYSRQILIVTQICLYRLSRRHPTIYSTSENQFEGQRFSCSFGNYNVQHSVKHKAWFWWINGNL
jgi:hypothetical protein